jgi:uncharacterized protein
MGRCDSSTQHGSHGEICSTDRRTTETASAPVTQRERRSIGAWALLLLVRLYILFLSPILGGACKFYPSCSNYACEAVSRHGAWRGSVLTVKRLLRCRPFTTGGFDPVPEVIYKEDAMQGPKSADVPGAKTASGVGEHHRPTQPVITEAWSAAGTLGTERRL